jgi:integrase
MTTAAPIQRARHDPACLHRRRTARPRRVPGRLSRPGPRRLRPGPAPVHNVMPRPVPEPVRRPPRRHRRLRPAPGSTRRARATVTGGCAPSPGSTGTPSRKNSWITHPPRMSAAREWTMSLTSSPCSSAVEHALISLLALNGVRVYEATGADIEHLGLERGHRTLTITRKGGLAKTKFREAGISPELCHLILHDRAARPRRQRDRDLRTYPVHCIDNLASHRAIAADTPAPARRVSMPHHIKTEALRDTGVSHIVPDFRYLPGRQDELPGPVSRGGVADNAGPVLHTLLSRGCPRLIAPISDLGCTPATSSHAADRAVF